MNLGKDRSPAAVLGLSIITFGIYYLFWYYEINAEIEWHDPDIAVSPGLAVLAQFFPIANLISGFSTAARIRQMQLDDGATQTISPSVALLWMILFGIGYPLYIASQLREHWHGHRRGHDVSTDADRASGQILSLHVAHCDECMQDLPCADWDELYAGPAAVGSEPRQLRGRLLAHLNDCDRCEQDLPCETWDELYTTYESAGGVAS